MTASFATRKENGDGWMDGFLMAGKGGN